MSNIRLRIATLLVILIFLTSWTGSFADAKGVRVDVPVFKQTWMPWAKEKLGFTQSNIEDRGCALLCVSMVMKYYGVDTDPSKLNNWLKENGGFQGGSMVWSALSRIGSNVSYQGKISFAQGIDYDRIKSELDKGYPLIAELDTSTIGMHFVVITGHVGNDFYINDSSFDNTSLLLSKVHGNISNILKAVNIYHGNTKPVVNVVDYASQYDSRKSIEARGEEIPNIKLKLNSYEIEVNTFTKTIETAPIVQEGRTFIPIRSILEEAGANIIWNKEDNKATIELGKGMIELWLNQKVYFVNGWRYEFDASPRIINGRTMIPLRGLFEKLGFKVIWDKDTEEISISSEDGISSPNKIKVYSEYIEPKALVKNYIELEEQERYSALPNYISQKGLSNLGRTFNKAVIGKEYIGLKEGNKKVQISFKEEIEGNNAYVGIAFTDATGKVISTAEKIALKLVKSQGLWYVEDRGDWYYPK